MNAFYYAFSESYGTIGINKIDLSGCTALNTIHIGAFSNSFNGCGIPLLYSFRGCYGLALIKSNSFALSSATNLKGIEFPTQSVSSTNVKTGITIDSAAFNHTYSTTTSYSKSRYCAIKPYNTNTTYGSILNANAGGVSYCYGGYIGESVDFWIDGTAIRCMTDVGLAKALMYPEGIELSFDGSFVNI
ncbi:MAG: hypothetical protein K2O54_05915 [Prevotella sp.]|nr:hypothetical protein [Prevotella sp.]